MILGRVDSVAKMTANRQTASKTIVGKINFGLSLNLGVNTDSVIEITMALILNMMLALLSAIELKLTCVL